MDTNVIERRIYLKTPQDVKDFCYAASALPRTVSVKVTHNEYIVDGKSILGMFSLNLSQPVTVQFVGNKDLNYGDIKSLFNAWIAEDNK